jgi:hypothetical protein
MPKPDSPVQVYQIFGASRLPYFLTKSPRMGCNSDEKLEIILRGYP